MKKVLILVTALISFGLLATTVYMIHTQNKILEDAEKGRELVKTLYQFNDLLELDKKQEDLEKLCTREVFEQIGVDYNQRGLNTYLKFKGGPSFVHVEKAAPGYVIYNIESEHIAKGRTFVLFYTLDRYGKVDYVREGELYDFD